MPGSRAQQKQKTRYRIIDAAFNLLSQERSYSSLSLREVTREAGIAPTSFYRHFEDMEALGLTLVDEGALALRHLMREARQRLQGKGSVIQISVETFMEFIENSPQIFRLLLQERSGTTSAFRQAVSRELQYFVTELAEYIQQTRGYPLAEARVQAEAMVFLVFNAGADALDREPSECAALSQKAIMQLRFVARGADEFLKLRHPAP